MRVLHQPSPRGTETLAPLYLLAPGDEVRVYWEQSQEWEGPLRVVRLVAKFVCITDRKKVKALPRSAFRPITSQSRATDLPKTIKDI